MVGPISENQALNPKPLNPIKPGTALYTAKLEDETSIFRAPDPHLLQTIQKPKQLHQWAPKYNKS